MAEFNADVRDVKFVLFQQLDMDRVCGLERFAGLDRDTLEAVIDEAFRLAKDRIAPLNATGDKEGVHYDAATRQVTMPAGFREAFQLYCENGWMSLAHSPEFGGQGMPYAVHLAAHDFFFGACLSFCLSSLLTTGAAHLIEVFGTDELKQRYVEKMYTGQWTGTMCLTEAGAGTDVGACQTRAKKQGDHYLIEGEKIFITCGEHDLAENIVHAVLARIEGAPAGTKGISLFVVPKRRVGPDGSLGELNDVRCSGVEHKMGIHASPTCSLVFGEEGSCQGYLLGEENKGMRAMFQMMNEARIEVGLQGAAIGNAAYQFALQYAAERVQSKPVLSRDPAARSAAIIEHPDVRRMLLWQKAWCEGGRALLLRAAVYGDLAHGLADADERAEYQGLLELLTPICKAWATDQGYRSTELAIQTLGGYGYCNEFPVEQYARDVKITSIYEGTNGIQALDLVGRKLSAKGGAHVHNLLGRIGKLVEVQASHPVLDGAIGLLGRAREAVAEVSMYFAKVGAKNPMVPIVEAKPYLDIFGDLVVGWLLLEQATIAHPKLAALLAEAGIDAADRAAVAALCQRHDEAKYYDGKIKVAQFFAQRALALCPAKAQCLQAGDPSPLEVTL